MPTARARWEGRFAAKTTASLTSFCSIVSILFALASISAAGAEAKRVLIVHSFGTVAPPFTIHSRAFETELVQRIGERVDLDEVSLDMARYADPHLQDALVDYLEKRQAQWQPDLVVPIGSPAGAFVARYRQRLFPDTPILYCGMDRRRLPADALANNAAFVGENFDLPGFAEEILQIAPRTKNIAVVIGASPVERYWGDAFRRAFLPFAGRVNFIWLDDLPFEQMLDRVSKLPPDSFIFLVLLLRDAAGVSHNADEALRRMHAVANAPINSIFQHQLGLGVVGGRLYQAENEGIEAAHIAVRILHGEAASSFPPKFIGPLAPRYDWRELKRWKIDEKRLPPGSTVLFRSPTFWQRYHKWIIAGGSIFLIQALLIAGLLANLIRRRRAEGSLAESETRFHTTADAAPVLVWLSGPDKLCTFFNKAWLEFTGRTMKQELGNGWCDGVHPDDLERCLATYTGAFDARQPFVMQYRLRRHDGRYRFITDQGVPRYGSKGRFRGYVGAGLDITEMLEKEQALHEVEERVTLAAEVAHLGIWELDILTNNLWISDNGRKLFRFPPGEPLSYERFLERVHPEDRARHAAAMRQGIENQGGYEIEYRFLLPDRTVRWIAGRGRYVSDPETGTGRFMGISMDVTEHKQARQLFRLATEASHLGIWDWDELSGKLSWDGAMREIFDVPREGEITMETWYRAIYPSDLERAKEAWREAIESGVPYQFEYRIQRSDGAIGWVHARGRSYDDDKGTPLRMMGIVFDITERKRAEEEAQRRRDEVDLLSRVSLLGEMTASIAHEVNQPLSGIISNASAGQRFIDRGQTDPENLREILVDIAADGRRAYDVIRNIRNTIKKGGAIRERLNLNDVVTTVGRLIQSDAATHSCELQTTLEENLPSVSGDPVQIQQVLINLIGNAFDAMNEAPVEQRKVIVSTVLNGGETVEVSVRDHGPGIREEVRGQLFERFFTTKEDGLGMGLAIVRSIVEAHSGTIVAENVAGGGARFRVTLPINKEEKS